VTNNVGLIEAPFQIHLVSLHKEEGDEVFNFAKEIYENLNKSHVEVLWDNRSGVGAGEKFADADLIGIPLRVLVSSKTIAEGNVEIKERKSENSELISKEQFLKSYTEDCK
jgi:prolyl-tRNA synthetase